MAERARQIDSAYNFVPLSGYVLEPCWGSKVSHDVPFRNGVSGRLGLTVRSDTPILVAGDRAKTDRAARFFRAPDGAYAIPGSALRGMIRSVIEIAAFGAMRLVDDRRLGLRDLGSNARAFYGDELTCRIGTRDDRPVFEPLSQAGWLRLEGTADKPEWRLTPCDVARIEHSELGRFKLEGAIHWSGKASAQERYCAWKRMGGCLDQKLWVADPDDHRHSPGFIRYRKASLAQPAPPANAKPIAGRLVFTGNTGVRTRPKHMEFYFFSSGQSSEVVVDSKVMDGFFTVHGKNEDWTGRWQPALRAGEGVPVFWLADPAGRPKKLGLAMMFKLAYDLTIGEVVAHTNPKHVDDQVLDLATLMFGRAARDEDRERDALAFGLKGRVSFGLAPARDHPQPEQHGPTVLNGPKPTYYPNYIRQPETSPGQIRGTTYATYKAVPDAPEAERRWPEIRGRKRYPVRPEVVVPAKPAAATDDPTTVLHPLPAGTVFDGELRFHNLRPEELGALLFALEWGGDPALRHALGMAKPFGFGQVSITVDRAGWSQLIANDPQTSVQTFEHYVDTFESYMDEHYRASVRECARGRPPPEAGWRQSEQMVQLLAMARPTPAAERSFPGKLQAMTLSVSPQRNDFKDAKDGRLVLAEYTRFSGPRDVELFPRPTGDPPSTTKPGAAPRGNVGPSTAVSATSQAGAALARFGLRPGQTVVVAGAEGTVTGVEGDMLLADFGDGPELIDPADIDHGPIEPS